MPRVSEDDHGLLITWGLDEVNGAFVCLLYGKHTLKYLSTGRRQKTLTFQCSVCGVKRTYRRRHIHRLLAVPGVTYKKNYRCA